MSFAYHFQEFQNLFKIPMSAFSPRMNVRFCEKCHPPFSCLEVVSFLENGGNTGAYLFRGLLFLALELVQF